MKFGAKGVRDASFRRRIGLGALMAGVSLACAAAGMLWWRHRHAKLLVVRAPTAVPLQMGPTGPLYPDPPGILIHHSDTPAKLHGVAFNAATLDRIAKKRGFSIDFEGKTYHISYHYVILPDGTIETGRPDHCQGAHCPKYNNWLGICLIGDFHDKTHWWPSTPTAAEKKSLVSLCESLMTKYHIRPENVRRHRDVHETWCPGNRFPYGEIEKQLAEYAAVHPETLTGAPMFPVPTAEEKARELRKAE